LTRYTASNCTIISGVRIGVVILPTQRWAAARSIWQRAEAWGAHSAWTYDHLTWRDMRDGPWLAALPVLSAAATVTTTLRLGTLVTSPNFRHPVTLAKEAMTIDDLSDGRFTLGIGAGGTGWDAAALGQAPWSAAERASRFEEFVSQLDRLLAQPDTAELRGQWYAALEARCRPGCVQVPRVPFAIAGGGPRAMRLAARYGDVWVTVPDGSDQDPREHRQSLRARLDRLDQACAAEGRGPANIGRLYLQGFDEEPWLASLEAFRDIAGRYAETGFTDLALHWPRTEPPFVADLDVFEAVLREGVAT
jgi:alkanesulfonate monooxygenase SsuD/methylene tetrahydromethanopterin reductase-like flavin-dependent oxidoreductase (luciferase family)